ncbi:hypothetical protein [Clostridium sp.]|uniref:hypothetical protein n=1 Tax=Clostridium sp. TaxID=1506 RepID=UPI003D6C7501
MTKNNGDKPKLLIVLGVIAVGAIAYSAYRIKKSALSNKAQGNTQDVKSTSNTPENKKAKEDIQNYLKKIKESYRDYYLYNHYSILFDIQDFKIDYSNDENLHKTYMEIGLFADGKKSAEDYMKNVIGDIFKKYDVNSYSMADSDYKSFLEKYYEVIGKNEALDIIEQKTDKINELNKTKQKNNELIKKILGKYIA